MQTSWKEAQLLANFSISLQGLQFVLPVFPLSLFCFNYIFFFYELSDISFFFLCAAQITSSCLLSGAEFCFVTCTWENLWICFPWVWALNWHDACHCCTWTAKCFNCAHLFNHSMGQDVEMPWLQIIESWHKDLPETSWRRWPQTLRLIPLELANQRKREFYFSCKFLQQ